MPRKKASRAPSRAKPKLPQDITEVDVAAEERQKKLDLLLKDFDVQVAERIALMEKEALEVQDSIHNMYKSDLARYSETTRKMLWTDYLKKDKEPLVVRKSVDELISCADVLLGAKKPKKGRGKAKANSDIDTATPSVTKSSRSNRQKNVLGTSQIDNMQPPPSTARVPRSRKVNSVYATPANQGVTSTHLTSMMITPKFDPRTPLPPGTLKRKPKLGEIAISLTGSPLQVSPKGWFSTLTTDNIDEQTRQELKLFHERVGQILNM